MPPAAPKKSNALVIVLVVLGGLLVLGFGSCVAVIGLGAFVTSDSKPAAPPPAQVTDINTLLREYRDNEVRADGLYKDKWVQTTGFARDVKNGVLGQAYITVGTGEILEIPVVQCTLDDAGAKQAAGVHKDTLVTVRGRVQGLMFNVMLQDCQIVPAPGG